MGEDKAAVEMQEELLEQGLFLQAIRPPQFREGPPGFDLIVRDLTREDIDYTIEAGAVGKNTGLFNGECVVCVPEVHRKATWSSFYGI